MTRLGFFDEHVITWRRQFSFNSYRQLPCGSYCTFCFSSIAEALAHG